MKNSATKKFMSVFFALIMLVSMFAGTAFADDSSSGSSSDVNPTGPDSGAAPYISAFIVQAPGTSTELQTVDIGTSFDIALTVQDGRVAAGNFKDLNNLGLNIMARLSSSAFSMSDVNWVDYKIKSSSDTFVSYSIVFHNVKYLGGDANFDFTLSYFDLVGTNSTIASVPLQTLSQKIGICNTSAAAKPTLAPKSISTSTNNPVAGTTFTVSGNAQNTSMGETVENVIATLTTDTQLSLASGSNSTYIGNIAPGASASASFEVLASAAAEPGTYKATITYTGTWGGEQVQTSQDVAVTVSQEERFEISKIELSDVIYIGEEGDVTAYFVNKGKGIIYNLTAEIKGDNIMNPGQQQFIGNVAAGTENSVDFYIEGIEAGAINGKVVLTYEDSNGNQKTLEKEFSVSVEENQYNYDNGFIDDGGYDVMPEEPSGMPVWLIIVIVVVCLAVVGGVVTLIVVLKKRKAKKLALEDEDEDI